MASNDPPIEDPFQRKPRILRPKTTRRIGQPTPAKDVAELPEPPSAAMEPAAAIAAPPALIAVMVAADAPLIVAAEPELPPEPSAPATLLVQVEATTPAAEEELIEVDSPTVAVDAVVVPEMPAPQLGPPDQESPPTSRFRLDAPPEPRLDAEQHHSGTSASSTFMIVVLSVVLVGYAFNIGSIQSAADAALARLNTTAQAQGTAVVPVVAKLIPWLVLVPAVILLYTIMKSIAAAIGLASKPAPKARKTELKSPPRPVDAFKSALATHGIESRTAYQAYLLLQPRLKEEQALDPRMSLETTLGMTHPQIREVHLNLLRATEHDADPGSRLPVVRTVLDLVAAVQRAPRRAREPLEPVFEPGDPAGKYGKARTKTPA